MRNPMVHHIQKVISDNLPQILSGVAVAGLIGTAVLAVKATPNALEDIELTKHNLGQGPVLEPKDGEEDFVYFELSPVQVVQATWRGYIPAAICGAATIACIVGSNTIGMRRNAAILAAYTLVDTNFREYKDKVLEHVTAPKARKIDDEIAEDKIKKNPPKESTIIITGGGDQLCCDTLTGRYFKSSPEKIRRAALDIDARILGGDLYASQNEFYHELGLDSCAFGDQLGWTIECRLEVNFGSFLTEDQNAVLAVEYAKLPVYNYDKL
jgi:hypothetical protein